MNAAGFAEKTGVSRETIEKLTIYQRLLEKWQAKINLVSATTLPETWLRHFYDSWQVLPALGDAQSVADLGAGAGFPGLVIAICAPEKTVHLVESDSRKCAFQIEVARETGAKVQIHNIRAERLAGELHVDAVTSRALAPLDKLLDLAVPLLKPGGLCTFLKGATYKAELTAAESTWHMRVDVAASLTEPDAALLTLREITRK
ncbi:MAG: 16S rRNA (guanine(527)-N(7))-methyltransferase RsmG [Alphaproteobacteria bacterium]|nr:16S rRNA (guanine(527)-N(7))-methyltransferase RsmG [Alphaproteobacteria bacterium]